MVDEFVSINKEYEKKICMIDRQTIDTVVGTIYLYIAARRKRRRKKASSNKSVKVRINSIKNSSKKRSKQTDRK